MLQCRYGISPCSDKKWVVIGLSEDIVVKSVVIANYEKYSSMLNEFAVLAATSYASARVRGGTHRTMDRTESAPRARYASVGAAMPRVIATKRVRLHVHNLQVDVEGS